MPHRTVNTNGTAHTPSGAKCSKNSCGGASSPDEQRGISEGNDMLKTFSDFVDVCCKQIPLPETDVRRLLALHLRNAKIAERDIIVYINYPEYTERELAIALDLSESAVRRTLNRVRKAWPPLLNDPGVNQHGCPALRHMKRIEGSAYSDDRLNDQKVLRF